MKITSLTNSYIKELYALKDNNEKKLKKLFLTNDIDIINLAFEKGFLKQVLYYKKPLDLDIDQLEVNEAIIKKLSFNKSYGDYIGVCTYPKFTFENKRRYLYLDNVQDPGNVGTLIRTCLAFSYDGIILSPDSASIYNDKVIQASKGGIFSLPIYTDISLKEMKDKGYLIIGTGLRNSINLKEVKIDSKFSLVLGNEGQGMKKENIDLASIMVKIEMDNIESLNVAISGGILLYEFKDC